MSEWKKYKRKGLSEMRTYVPGEDLSHVSISEPDKQAGSPKAGDMIARNPKNHADQWLVAKKYFEDNLELSPRCEKHRERVLVSSGGYKDASKCCDGAYERVLVFSGAEASELADALAEKLEQTERDYEEFIGLSLKEGFDQAVLIRKLKSQLSKQSALLDEVKMVLESVRGFEIIGERTRSKIDQLLTRLGGSHE